MQIERELPRRHQCLIYEGAPSRHLDSLAETIIQKLKTNHRCLYLNSPPMVAGIRSRLAAVGLNLADHTESGALVLSSGQDHLVDGRFDVDGMLRLLSDAVCQALADGYTGLWATGDMAWEFGNETNLDKLLEYERRLEEFMLKNPALSGVCQYHRDSLPPHAIEAALKTHPVLYIDGIQSRSNRDYCRI